jgi:hypothetical protein
MDQDKESRTARCPRAFGRAVDRLTGELRTVSCLSYRCGRCGPRLALATVAAIEVAKPHSSMVFTFRSSLSGPDLGKREDFAAFHHSLRAMAQGIRAEGHEWETAWIVEVSQRGIPHVHLLQSGDTLPLARLLIAAREVGFGWAQTQPIRHLRTMARYVLKAALRGLDLPLTQATQAMHQHLRLNGGWLIRYTSRFWKAPDGRILGGVRQARIEALKALGGRTGRGQGVGGGTSRSGGRYPSESYAVGPLRGDRT